MRKGDNCTPFITTKWAGKLTPHAKVLVDIKSCIEMVSGRDEGEEGKQRGWRGGR